MRSRILLAAATLALTAGPVLAEHASERLQEATAVFNEVMGAPDKGIPQDLLTRAHCVVIVPNLKKAAFIVGGQYGRGFAVCRAKGHAGWGAPASVRLEGGSVGFQIGAESTDLIMLVMGQHGMNQLLDDKFTLGGSASVAAGPVGRSSSADTDAFMRAEILSWSRAQGVFAGISLNGSTLRTDLDENKELYGRPLHNRDVLMTNLKPPAAAGRLLAALSKYSVREAN